MEMSAVGESVVVEIFKLCIAEIRRCQISGRKCEVLDLFKRIRHLDVKEHCVVKGRSAYFLDCIGDIDAFLLFAAWEAYQLRFVLII